MALAPSLCPLWDLRRKHKLGVQVFLQPRPDLGKLPMQVLTRSLLAPDIGQWFKSMPVDNERHRPVQGRDRQDS